MPLKLQELKFDPPNSSNSIDSNGVSPFSCIINSLRDHSSHLFLSKDLTLHPMNLIKHLAAVRKVPPLPGYPLNKTDFLRFSQDEVTNNPYIQIYNLKKDVEFDQQVMVA